MKKVKYTEPTYDWEKNGYKDSGSSSSSADENNTHCEECGK